MSDMHEQSPGEDAQAPSDQETEPGSDATSASSDPTDAALPAQTSVADRPDGLPVGYELLEDGLYSISPSGKQMRLGSWLRVVACFREATGQGWGKVIELRDPEGQLQRHLVLNGEISGQWPRVLSDLQNLGFEPSVEPASIKQLKTLLMTWKPKAVQRRVRQSGWVEDGLAFVLGDRVFGCDRIVTDLPSMARFDLNARGTLEEWQARIGRKAVGNPLLALGLSVAFFGPVQGLLGRDLGGGIHLMGSSSSGKSTIAEAAASVWGGPRMKRSWNATINGLEAVAAALNGTLLVLDEIGEAPPRQIGETIYMLANEVGRSRMSGDGSAQDSLTWALPFLSTGETRLSERLAETGKRVMGGQSVRLIEVEADGRRFRAFDELQGATDGAAFARDLKDATLRCHGTAGVAFLERLVADREAAILRIRTLADAFRREALLRHADPLDGPAERVLERLAFIAAAGELASEWDITGWPAGEATRALLHVFEEWLDARADDSGEGAQWGAERHLAKVRTHLAATTVADLRVPPVPVLAAAWHDGVKLFIPASTWLAIHGPDKTIAAQNRRAAGVLQPGDGGNMMVKAPRAIPGRPRVYSLRLDKVVPSVGSGGTARETGGSDLAA